MNADGRRCLESVKGAFENHPAVFEARVFEVDDEADGKTGDAEVIELLSDFEVGDSFNGFGINDDFLESD